MSQGDAEQEPSYWFVSTMRRIRQERGWSQERLVEEVDRRTGLRLNATVVTKLEWVLNAARREQARTLSLDEAVAIATTLGVSLQSMINDRLSLAEGEDAERYMRAIQEGAAARAMLGELTFRRQMAERELAAMTAEMNTLHQRIERASMGTHPSGLHTSAQSVRREGAEGA